MGPILDVAIGLILIYLVLSLIASAITELLESVLRTRAKYLWMAMGELLGDPPRRGSKSNCERPPRPSLADFYNHPLICGLFYDSYENAQRSLLLRSLPSYIPRGHFATTVIDLVARQASNQSASTMTALREGVQRLDVTPVTTPVTSLLRVSGDDLPALQAAIESWYEGAMNRATGWYKRHSQILLLVTGYLVATAINADTIGIARYLSLNEEARTQLVAAAVGSNPATTNVLGLLSQVPATNLRWLGYLITACAVSIGAPFWFDLLKKFVNVRAAGATSQEGAAATTPDGVRPSAFLMSA